MSAYARINHASTTPKGKGKGKDEGKGGRDRSRSVSVPPGQRKGPRGKSPSGREDRPHCTAFLAGKCKKGDKCDFYHSPICCHYVKGTCDQGHKCKFAHIDNPKAAAAKAEAKGKAEPKGKAKAEPKGKAKAEGKKKNE